MPVMNLYLLLTSSSGSSFRSSWPNCPPFCGYMTQLHASGPRGPFGSAPTSSLHCLQHSTHLIVRHTHVDPLPPGSNSIWILPTSSSCYWVTIPWWPCIRLRDLENYKSSPEFLHASHCQQGLTSVLDRRTFQLFWTKQCIGLRVSGMTDDHIPNPQAFWTQPVLRIPHSYLILLYKVTPLFSFALAYAQRGSH